MIPKRKIAGRAMHVMYLSVVIFSTDGNEWYNEMEKWQDIAKWSHVSTFHLIQKLVGLSSEHIPNVTVIINGKSEFLNKKTHRVFLLIFAITLY